MKIVLAEWLKDKKAFVLIVISVLMGAVYSVLNSTLIIKIRDALDNVSDASKIKEE